MSTQASNNQPNKKDSKEKAVSQATGNPREISLYTRTASEQDAARLVVNSTGIKSNTPDFTAVSKIDPRYLGLDEYSDYIESTEMYLKFSCDAKGIIRLQDAQLIEKNPSAAENVFGKRIFNTNELGVNGTSDLRVYSRDNSSLYIDGSFHQRSANVQTGEIRYGILDTGRITPVKTAKTKINVLVHLDDISKDYNMYNENQGKDFITNSTEGRPVEIDKKISELLSFYTSDQYASYYAIQKTYNGQFYPFEKSNFPKDISFYEANTICQDVSKYLTMDTSLFQSKGATTVDYENFTRNVGSIELEALKDYQNKKIALYKECKEVYLRTNPHLRVNGSDIMEVKRAAMSIVSGIQNDSGFIKSCAKLEEELQAKLYPSLKLEIETKLQQLEGIHNHTASNPIKFDLYERLEKMEMNQTYAKAVNEWINFKPIIPLEPGQKLDNKKLEEAFDGLQLSDYANFKYMSKEELITRWNKLSVQMEQLIPTSNTNTDIDYRKGIQIENTAKAMELMKDMIISHPDNQKAFKFNPYATGDIDEIPLDMTTYYAIKKIEGHEANTVLKDISADMLKSRTISESLITRLKEETINKSFNIDGKDVNLQTIFKDEKIMAAIDELSFNSKFCNANEINSKIKELVERISVIDSDKSNQVANATDAREANKILEDISARKNIIESAVRNEIAEKIIATHISANDYELNIDKHMKFVTINNKTKIAHEMFKHHKEVLDIYQSVNPVAGINPALHDKAITEVKSFLAARCNLSNSEIDALSQGDRDFFKTNSFYQLIQNPSEGTARTFEQLTGLKDMKTDLQDPIKCKAADEALTKELQRLSGTSSDNSMNNDGRRTLIEDYQRFLREHIAENRQQQYLERKNMVQMNQEIHLEPKYFEMERAMLLNSEKLSASFKENHKSPYAMINELNKLEPSSNEYRILSNTLENPSIRFQVRESNKELLSDAENKEKLIDYIVKNIDPVKINKSDILKLVDSFERSENIEFQKNSEFMKSLPELPFDDYKTLKDFKAFYEDSKSNSSNLQISEIKDLFCDKIENKDYRERAQSFLDNNNELITKYLSVSQESIIGSIISRADNPLYCKAKIEELKDLDPIGVKKHIVNDIETYVARESSLIKDAIIEESTRKSVETAPSLDVDIFEQSIRNNGIEARTALVQDIIEKGNRIVDGKKIESYKINEEARSYYDSRLKDITVNFVTDWETESVARRVKNRPEKFNISEIEKKGIFEQGFGSQYGIINQRREHINAVTENIVRDIHNLHEIHSTMKNHNISVSENHMLYRKLDSEQSVNKEILDIIANEKNIRSKIIEIDNALDYNSLTKEYPNREKLMEEMNKKAKEIEYKESYLEKLKEENRDSKLSLSQLQKSFKSFIANRGGKALSDNNEEIMYLTKDIELLKKQYEEKQNTYLMTETNIEKLKSDAETKIDTISSDYKKAFETLGISKHNFNMVVEDVLVKEANSKEKHFDAYSLDQSFKNNIVKLMDNKINIIDLPNEDIMKLDKLIILIREEKINDNSLTLEEKGEIARLNVTQNIAEAVTQCRQINEYVLLTQYKEALNNLLEHKESVTKQEYTQIVNLNYGYSHTTTALTSELDNVYSPCKKTFEQVAECKKLLQSLGESLTDSAKVNEKSIENAVKLLTESIATHNQNVQAAELKMIEKPEILEDLNKRIITESAVSHEIRNSMLTDHNDGQKGNIYYGQEVMKEYMNKVELSSVLVEMKNEELISKIENYIEKQNYEENIKKVQYGKTETELEKEKEAVTKDTDKEKEQARVVADPYQVEI